MSHRPSLRTIALLSATVGGVLVPSTAAFATDSPSPTVTERPEATPSNAPTDAKQSKATPSKAPTASPSVPTDRSAAPAPAVTAPRGGVAAGERPADTGSATGALAGTAAGAALLAGAGTFVIRRRSSAAHRNG
ncbi:LPXTG cell wall anchor domain-containing protein [Streptomyces sp. NPDC091292]|uniref:LPXTG cell wall anchor domain-containing protein n=1 Tax=Streptomyces sp. NPDC091292 TaxID=3365991 RepID=UPI0038019F1B